MSHEQHKEFSPDDLRSFFSRFRERDSCCQSGSSASKRHNRMKGSDARPSHQHSAASSQCQKLFAPDDLKDHLQQSSEDLDSNSHYTPRTPVKHDRREEASMTSNHTLVARHRLPVDATRQKEPMPGPSQKLAEAQTTPKDLLRNRTALKSEPNKLHRKTSHVDLKAFSKHSSSDSIQSYKGEISSGSHHAASEGFSRNIDGHRMHCWSDSQDCMETTSNRREMERSRLHLKNERRRSSSLTRSCRSRSRSPSRSPTMRSRSPTRNDKSRSMLVKNDRRSDVESAQVSRYDSHGYEQIGDHKLKLKHDVAVSPRDKAEKLGKCEDTHEAVAMHDGKKEEVHLCSSDCNLDRIEEGDVDKIMRTRIKMPVHEDDDDDAEVMILHAVQRGKDSTKDASLQLSSEMVGSERLSLPLELPTSDENVILEDMLQGGFHDPEVTATGKIKEVFHDVLDSELLEKDTGNYQGIQRNCTEAPSDESIIVGAIHAANDSRQEKPVSTSNKMEKVEQLTMSSVTSIIQNPQEDGKTSEYAEQENEMKTTQYSVKEQPDQASMAGGDSLGSGLTKTQVEAGLSETQVEAGLAETQVKAGLAETVGEAGLSEIGVEANEVNSGSDKPELIHEQGVGSDSKSQPSSMNSDIPVPIRPSASSKREKDATLGPPTKVMRMDMKNGLIIPVPPKSTKNVEIQTDPVRILTGAQGEDDEAEFCKRLHAAIHESLFAELMSESGQCSKLWANANEQQLLKDKLHKTLQDLSKQVENMKMILKSMPKGDEKKNSFYLPPKSIRGVGLQAQGEAIDNALRLVEENKETNYSITVMTPRNMNMPTSLPALGTANTPTSVASLRNINIPTTGLTLRNVNMPVDVTSPRNLNASTPATANTNKGSAPLTCTPLVPPTSASLIDLTDDGPSQCATVPQAQSVPHRLEMQQLQIVNAKSGTQGLVYCVVTTGSVVKPMQYVLTQRQGVASTMVTSVLGTHMLPSAVVNTTGRTVNSEVITSPQVSPITPVPARKRLPPLPANFCAVMDPSLPKPMVFAYISDSVVTVEWTVAPGVNLSAVASYQIMCYNESEESPSNSPWNLIGDVKALNLPMKVTLNQMLCGRVYHFVIRAMNALSQPGPISEMAVLKIP